MISRTSWFRKAFVLAALIMASLACNLTDSLVSTSAGGRQNFNEYGFSLDIPADMSIRKRLGVGADISVPNADQSGDYLLGPYCSATVGYRTDLSAGLANGWKDRNDQVGTVYGLQVAAPQETSVAGKAALVGEISGRFKNDHDPKGSEAFGKLLMVATRDSYAFELFCLGPAGRKSETLNLYDSLAKSVQFFDPLTATPSKR